MTIDARMNSTGAEKFVESTFHGRAWRRDLAIVLRRYGFLGLDEKQGDSVSRRLRVENATLEDVRWDRDQTTVIFANEGNIGAFEGLDPKNEPGRGFLYQPRRRSWFSQQAPDYRPLLPHFSFSSNALTPILSTKEGRTVIGWWETDRGRNLIVGLNVVEELVRYTQGDPRRVETAIDKTLWGSGHERSAYLFDDNIVLDNPMVPWADRLGFLLARTIAEAVGLPLIAPLPNGARGAILLTGDDDEAYLEKYDEQLRILDGFPITYILLPRTRHSSDTLAAMPSGVEFGTHVDALPEPDNYAAICKAQTEAVRKLTGKLARTVRNHGHLNQGYWGHLPAWEETALTLDVNIRGLDGTCPTGSYLPFRVRRSDGSWSSHVSLFSTFSDSMLYLQKWPQRKQIRCIRSLADDIESSQPGVIVLNLHPQNVSDLHKVHRAVVKIGRRDGWVALGGETYIDWLAAVEQISLQEVGETLVLRSPLQIENVALVWPGKSRKPAVLPPWQGAVTL